MKKYSLFTILSSLLLMSVDCEREETPLEQTGTLELNFKGSFGDESLMMYAKDYAYEAGMKVKFQLFRFYLSDISVARSTFEYNTIISDVEIVDFKDIQSDAAAQNGFTVRIKNVPIGNYIGLNMGLGVSPKLNKTQPGDYSSSHPLSGNYWSWALGYVFTKIEGNADVDGDGQLTDKLTFHVGGDSYYRNKEFSKSFNIKEGETTRLDFEVDLQRVLVAAPGDFLDFRKVTIDHTNNVEVATFISDNLKEAIEIK
ncbi:MAG: MbnP family protein [Saprospiraceae bacterium]|nr:MbnP family protein [Saprospiraceae bacterium]